MDYKSAMEIIRSEVPVNLEFTKLDKKRNTGGDLVQMKSMIICGSSHNRKANGTITVRQIPDGHPITIHTKLIHKVNNEFVN